MNTYQAECVKLESTQWYEPNTRLLHAAMGLVTEAAELLNFQDEKNFLEELGDVMWYVAVGCDSLEITIHEAVEQAYDYDEYDPIAQAVTYSAEILDQLKKSIFYGRELDTKKIIYFLGCITLAVDLLANDAGSNLEEVEVLNLAKLHKRYKSGAFSSDDAINRDVKEEMTVYS